MYICLKRGLEEKFHFKKESGAKAFLTKNIPYSLPLQLYDIFWQTKGKRVSGTEKTKLWQNHQIGGTDRISEELNLRYLKWMNEAALQYSSSINEGFVE